MAANTESSFVRDVGGGLTGAIAAEPGDTRQDPRSTVAISRSFNTVVMYHKNALDYSSVKPPDAHKLCETKRWITSPGHHRRVHHARVDLRAAVPPSAAFVRP